MDKLFAAIFPHLLAWWHDRRLGWILPIGVAVLILGFRTDWGTTAPTKLTVLLAFAACSLIYGAWAATNAVPKNLPAKTGIVVAIVADDDAQDRQVRQDFIASLRERLTDDPEAARLNLVVFPRWLAANCQDTASAAKLLAKAKAHFILFGAVTRRTIDGKASHAITLTGMVRHAALPPPLQEDLKADFSRVAPRKVTFPDDNSIFSFEATSEWTDVSARYVIGVAALMSSDPWYAERLFLSVQARLRATSLRHAPLQEIARRLPERLRTLYDIWQAGLYHVYYMRRDKGVLRELRAVATKLVALDPTHYQGRLSLAICAFLLERDVKGALAHIRYCMQARDAAWRYSRAFLYAYQGDMARAREEYKFAFSARHGDETVPLQSEEFILDVLAEEPDRVQLHFVLGLINEQAKGDIEAARAAYERFVASDEASRFPKELETAHRKLVDLSRSPPVAG